MSTSDEQGIRNVDADMVAALNARDVDRWLSHLADDAEMWPPEAERVAGKQTIRDMISGFISSPTYAVTHDIESVVVAESGDIAWVTYSYTMGNPVFTSGKDLTVYRKDDGEWKMVIDMWSPNEPE